MFTTSFPKGLSIGRAPALACLLASSAVLFAGCSEAPPTAAARPADDAPVKGTATSILNAGVMTQMGAGSGDSGETGGAPLKFLFDPLYDDHFGSLEQLPDALIEAIVTGAPPYDGVDAVFVSHAHGDHFSARHLSRLLAQQPKAQLIAPGQAVDRMRQDENWRPEFEERVVAINLENGEASTQMDVAGAVVDAFRSPHSGWPDRHAGTHNITFRVSVEGATAADGTEGGAAARVMHLGDADPGSEHYAALSEFFAAKQTGLAMVPFWFYQQENLNAIIEETLNAQSAVAVHVPANVPEYLSSGAERYFSGVGEVLEIPLSR